MADELNTETTEATTDNTTATSIADAIQSMGDQLQTMSEKFETDISGLKKELEEAKAPQYPNGPPNGMQGFNIRRGENTMSSRHYSLINVAKALSAQRIGSQFYDTDWQRHAALEADISKKLWREYYHAADGNWRGFGGGGSLLVPLGASMLPATEQAYEDSDGKTQHAPAVSKELRKEVADTMALGIAIDFDELAHYGLNVSKAAIHKDLSANTATTGGTLVGLAAQGELIELLRAIELFSQVGAQQIDLPPQGSLRFPRSTSSVTIAATTEGATISESTPGTGALNLVAKPYTGLVDIPDELMRFSTSANVEAWLRSEFVREIGLKGDSDMVSGVGGSSIQGIINYSGVGTRTASTTAANGDTLDQNDPMLLYGDIADQNAPVDRGFFYAMTASLWAGLTTRASSSGGFFFAQTAGAVGGGRPVKTLNGEQVVCTTQVPRDRTKGSGTTLTILLGGVGSEWIIARAGVVDVRMTDSDASKFASRLVTMRGTQYVDAGPRHIESFAFIDELLDS